MRLYRGFEYALVVVLANVLLVTYEMTETSTAPRESALGEFGHAHPVPSTSIADPSRPITIPPAPQEPESNTPSTALPTPTSTNPPPVPDPIVTDPPRATLPSSSPPPLPAPPPPPAPLPAARVAPAVRFPDPVSNIPPVPNFLAGCGSTAYNDSFDCVWEVVTAIDNARAKERLPSMVLPRNWSSLTAAEQLFVATNLERTVRGLAPLSAMATVLDTAAAQGAAAGADPNVPPGFPWIDVGSNWAGPVGNPLEALYYWMYDDGFGSSNVACSLSNLGACWGHRRNVLLPLPCNLCVMGGAFATTVQRTISVTELIVEADGSLFVDFTWAQEQPYSH
jgi:hypothetical protein